MMSLKKKIIIIATGYALYGFVIWLYLFHLAPVGIATEYLNTAADPATFMTENQLLISTRFARTRQLIFFLATPFEWLMIGFFIFSGMSQRFEAFVTTKFSKRFLQITVYYFSFAVFTFLVMLPFRFISYQLARFYGTSTMTLLHWLRNRGIDFVVNFLLMVMVVQVLLFLMRKFQKSWWLVAWLIAIPFAYFFMLLGPILIDPLYNDFQPIQNVELETKILTMAQEAGVATSRVFEVVMSSQTNTINAYVTGVGPTARIVLWDTALDQLSTDEILFLMAHEIAHYVYRDVYRGIVVALVVAFAGAYVIYKVVEQTKKASLVRVPVMVVVASMFLFATSPVTNAISRRIEVRADAFAFELTQDADAGIGLFQTLATTALNEVNPPRLVRIFRSTHPSIFERINRLVGE